MNLRVDATIPLPWVIAGAVALIAGWVTLVAKVDSIAVRVDNVDKTLTAIQVTQDQQRTQVSTLQGDVNNQRIDTAWARKDTDDVKSRISKLEANR